MPHVLLRVVVVVPNSNSNPFFSSPGFNLMEMLWVFSIYLEAVAILPQLVVLQRYGEVENLTGNYILLMGSYRALYILNWIWRR